MSAINPYQAPQSAFASDSAGAEADDRDGPWRDGKDLVVRHDTRLPERCIKCNAAAKLPLKRKRYFWHHGGWYLLILINLILYAIVALFARKKTYMSAGLCEQHSKRRIIAIVAMLVGFCVAMGLVVFALGGGGESGPALLPIAAVLFIASIVIGMVAGRAVYPKRIGERYARFAGCGRAFLDTLPPFRGSDR